MISRNRNYLPAWEVGISCAETVLQEEQVSVRRGTTAGVLDDQVGTKFNS